MRNQSKKVGGETVHIQDCYVWAEIYYLDSPTDYRESVSKDPDYPVSVVASDLVMLDSSRNRPNSNPQAVWKMSGLLLVICGLLLYFLLYLLTWLELNTLSACCYADDSLRKATGAEKNFSRCWVR